MNRLIIIGASGHGRVVADIAKLCGYKDIVFLDDNDMIKKCAGFPVLGSSNMLLDLEGDLFVAVGTTSVRKKIMEKNSKRCFPVLIHPAAIIANETRIGDGSVVMAGVVINPGSKIGKGCIINTSSSIDHDCIIGDYCHVSVGTHLSGTITIGEGTWIGAGATVINNISICRDCTIGAGAVVVKNIEIPGTYVGVPAKRINSRMY